MLPEPQYTRRAPAIVLSVGVAACLLTVFAWEEVARLALLHTPILLTMGLIGVIDPRLFFATLPGRENIPTWARICGNVCFVGAALVTLILIAARYQLS